MSLSITPRYKLLMQYDIVRESHDSYYQFVVGEMVPTLQSLGVYMLQVYHTAYGPYPIRQVEFVAEDLDTIHSALQSDKWKHVEDKFRAYISNYTHKIVHFRPDSFQF